LPNSSPFPAIHELENTQWNYKAAGFKQRHGNTFYPQCMTELGSSLPGHDVASSQQGPNTAQVHISPFLVITVHSDFFLSLTLEDAYKEITISLK